MAASDKVPVPLRIAVIDSDYYGREVRRWFSDTIFDISVHIKPYIPFLRRVKFCVGISKNKSKYYIISIKLRSLDMNYFVELLYSLYCVER